MKIINTFRNRIECMHIGIPYKLKGIWYNQNIHVSHLPVQINTFRHNGTYIAPEKGVIIPVIFIEEDRRVYARYIITKINHESVGHKDVYTYDDVFCNLTYHSLMYII